MPIRVYRRNAEVRQAIRRRAPVILFGQTGLALLLLVGVPTTSTVACRTPLVGSADMEAIERAIVVLPAIGSKLFPMSVGTALPSGLETRPVPRAVGRILPKYAGYRAYRSGHLVVIVDPRSRRIAYLLHIGRSAASSCS